MDDDDSEHKKAKRTKKCAIKRLFKLIDYKNCLLNNKIILKLRQRFKSEYHNLYTEEINNIALGSNGDKKWQAFDKITTNPYRTHVFKACKSEILS